MASWNLPPGGQAYPPPPATDPYGRPYAPMPPYSPAAYPQGTGYYQSSPHPAGAGSALSHDATHPAMAPYPPAHASYPGSWHAPGAAAANSAYHGYASYHHPAIAYGQPPPYGAPGSGMMPNAYGAPAPHAVPPPLRPAAAASPVALPPASSARPGLPAKPTVPSFRSSSSPPHLRQTGGVVDPARPAPPSPLATGVAAAPHGPSADADAPDPTSAAECPPETATGSDIPTAPGRRAAANKRRRQRVAERNREQKRAKEAHGPASPSRASTAVGPPAPPRSPAGDTAGVGHGRGDAAAMLAAGGVPSSGTASAVRRPPSPSATPAAANARAAEAAPVLLSRRIESPEEIAAWIAERRAAFPTAANVARKQREARERRARGEAMPSNPDLEAVKRNQAQLFPSGGSRRDAAHGKPGSAHARHGGHHLGHRHGDAKGGRDAHAGAAAPGSPSPATSPPGGYETWQIYRRPNLLRSLLRADIERDKSHVLQVIYHVLRSRAAPSRIPATMPATLPATAPASVATPSVSDAA